ncbi:MAG: hypothetical protein WEC35_06580 [Nitrosopumilaceae archaeon]
MNYEKLCTDIFAIDSSIRFASVYNKHGEVVAGGMSKDKESLLNPKEAKMSIYYSKNMFEKHKKSISSNWKRKILNNRISKSQNGKHTTTR